MTQKNIRFELSKLHNLPPGPAVRHPEAGPAAVADPADDEPLRLTVQPAAAWPNEQDAAAAANATAANASSPPAATAPQPDGPSAFLHRPGRPPTASATTAEEDLGAAAAHQLRDDGPGAVLCAAGQAAVGRSQALRRVQRPVRQPPAAATAAVRRAQLRLPLRQVPLRAATRSAHGAALRRIRRPAPNATDQSLWGRPVSLHAVPSNAPSPAKRNHRRPRRPSTVGGSLQAPRLWRRRRRGRASVQGDVGRRVQLSGRAVGGGGGVCHVAHPARVRGPHVRRSAANRFRLEAVGEGVGVVARRAETALVGAGASGNTL